MRKLFILLLFFVETILFSQNLSFVYEVTINSAPDKKLFKTENYFLDISDEKSVFRSENDRYYDSLREKTGKGLGTPLDFNQLYSHKEKSREEIYKTVTIPFVLNTYDVLIDEKLDWKLLSDSATIAGLKCQKATVNYGGRNWEAWFAKSIAIQDGPYVFHGLPGLIIQITDSTNDFRFSLVYYSDKKNRMFFPSKKGKVLSFTQFKLLEENFYNQPFAELESSGMKIVHADEKGNKLPWNSREMSQKMQRVLKENNNPIELNYKPNFK
ncbi:GLPGLI family protein [uncultured Chryseobacterium sp.]|uniref:GLPGLI family protein n=1 Tax=uncultured Chryseobacterium sp. TaxID=259322 RepID=UPI0025D4B8EF|nr:GLPGLI family protein [uncultured Chryseobacterium sp.]